MLYKLSNDSLLLEVNNHGAEVNKLIIDGVSIIRTKDEVWGRSAPFLFPIVGCLKDGYTIINGKEYHITKHGFLRDHDLKLLSKSNNSLEFIDKYSDESLKMFPFKYEAYIKYELLNKAVKTTIKIKNVDEVAFSYNIGGHPGFNCPLFDNEAFEDYRIVFEKSETFDAPLLANDLLDFSKPVHSFNNIKEINLDYKYFIPDALVLKNVKSKVVSLLNKEGKGIRFSYDGFQTIAFWTKPKNKYLCIEPWNGYDDLVSSNHIFSQKAELIEIMPGEEKEVSYTIELI